jgi:hypothetical protein
MDGPQANAQRAFQVPAQAGARVVAAHAAGHRQGAGALVDRDDVLVLEDDPGRG